MGYTSKETLQKIKLLVDQLFKSNAIVDNIVYNLDKLGYSILSENVHHHIAHAYGQQADVITEFLSLRNDIILRGNIVFEQVEYNDITDYLKIIIGVQDELEKMLKDCIVTSADNYDFAVEDMLRGFYKDILVKYTKQAHKLYDMSIKYQNEGNLSLFDSACTKYIIVD